MVLLKDEIDKICKHKQSKLLTKKKHKEYLLSLWKTSDFYLLVSSINQLNENIKKIRYDKQTKKLIKRLPVKIKWAARLGNKYVDVYVYKYYFFINPYLYENMAEYYLERDQRGLEIVEFLKKNKIKFYLKTNNNTMDSYYTIRVYFE